MIRFTWIARSLGALALVSLIAGCATRAPEPVVHRLAEENGFRWYKGNTHTHTLWSDGDAAPELAVSWYKEHGYDFLSLTDHNVTLHGLRLFPIGENTRLTPDRVAMLEEKFGKDNVKTWKSDGEHSMKLLTLEDLRERFEDPGKFLLIEGEEITGRSHVNGINTRGLINPSPSKDNVRSMRDQVTSVDTHSAEHDVPMFAHVNHINFSQGISAEELAGVTEGRYFEVYNGHRSVRNWGDDKRRIPSTDRKWDIVLAHRLAADPNKILYGVATDDTHNYFGGSEAHSAAGRGWSMVLAETLEDNAIAEAFLRGDFYASSGVTLSSITWDDNAYTITVDAEPGVTYTTQFIGTRKGFDDSSAVALDAEGKELPKRTRVYSDAIGEVLFETTAVPAVYPFAGDELYVRAKIVSSKLQSGPFQEGDLESAWTQPVVCED
jgi:hypothetical protein